MSILKDGSGGAPPPPLSSATVPGFTLKGIGQDAAEGTISVVQIVGAATSNFTIPFAHRILKVEVKHVNAVRADNTDALTWSLARTYVETGTPFVILSYTASTVTDKQIIMEDGFKYPDGQQYILTTNTTATHYVYFKITVEKAI